MGFPRHGWMEWIIEFQLDKKNKFIELDFPTRYFKNQAQIDWGRNTITHLRIRGSSFCVGQKIHCYFRNKNTFVCTLFAQYLPSGWKKFA